MGYCSATDYVDNAVAAADNAVVAALLAVAVDPDTLTTDQRLAIDDAMRPQLRVIIDKALEDDWDCEPDSHYIGRFPDLIDPDNRFTDCRAQAVDGRVHPDGPGTRTLVYAEADLARRNRAATAHDGIPR